ncbi:SHOCT domain-containing protein [Aureisphaera sp.]
MRKTTITILFILFIILQSTAQKKIEKLKEYKATNGVTYKIGDTLQLGKGSGQNGIYDFIHSTGLAVATSGKAQPLDAVNTKFTFVKVKKIKEYNSKHYKGVIMTVGVKHLTNHLIYVEEAIESCEILPCLKNEGGINQSDKYDQLAKIKKLLDDGVLTMKEFEIEKAKILNGNN